MERLREAEGYSCRSVHAVYLEQVGALPRAQTADVLHQALGVWVGDGLVYVHAHLIHTVDEFTVQGRQQIFLHHVFLRTEKPHYTNLDQGQQAKYSQRTHTAYEGFQSGSSNSKEITQIQLFSVLGDCGSVSRAG